VRGSTVDPSGYAQFAPRVAIGASRSPSGEYQNNGRGLAPPHATTSQLPDEPLIIYARFSRRVGTFSAKGRTHDRASTEQPCSPAATTRRPLGRLGSRGANARRVAPPTSPSAHMSAPTPTCSRRPGPACAPGQPDRRRHLGEGRVLAEGPARRLPNCCHRPATGWTAARCPTPTASWTAWCWIRRTWRACSAGSATTWPAPARTPRSARTTPTAPPPTRTGPRYHDAVLDLYLRAGVEAARVLRNHGVFIVKCQDEVSANRQRLTHVELINAFTEAGFLLQGPVHRGATQPTGIARLLRQARAQDHSYFPGVRQAGPRYPSGCGQRGPAGRSLRRRFTQ